MAGETPVDAVALREEVKDKYRAVAIKPNDTYHFHTGRPLAKRLGYDDAIVDPLPDVAVESFAGVGNPFALRSLAAGEKVVDIGSGAGHDACYLAQVAPTAMIFVPCVDGISHNEIEDAKPEWITAGGEVLLRAILDKAGR